MGLKLRYMSLCVWLTVYIGALEPVAVAAMKRKRKSEHRKIIHHFHLPKRFSMHELSCGAAGEQKNESFERLPFACEVSKKEALFIGLSRFVFCVDLSF